jgi:glycosyltransferase involved in cell wall biosynthesis
MSRKSIPCLGLVSRVFPPQVGGTPVLLSNLISGYPGEVRAVAGYSNTTAVQVGFHPPCPTRRLWPCSVFARYYEGLRRRWPSVVRTLIQPFMLAALKRSDVQVVMGVYPYEDFLVAGFLAARRLGLPYYVQMHDLWRENTPADSRERRFADRWEPIVLGQCQRLLCMTEAMQEHYHARYHRETELLPHCVTEADLTHAPVAMVPPTLTEPTVLFVGGVSPDMNLDALKVLASAADLLPPVFRLLFCTPTSRELLGQLGIASSRLETRFVSRQEVRQLESAAHVLLSPLSHKNGSVDEVRTVFSTKLLEYLVSGRPIVVFAPAGSHHARSAGERGWGYVVSEDSPQALARGIMEVFNKPPSTRPAVAMPGSMRPAFTNGCVLMLQVMLPIGSNP